jgi:TonB family protein
MNAVKKLAIVLSLGASVVSASAGSNEKAYVESFDGVTDQPVPVSVVAPAIITERGAEVILEFVVDTAGVPQGIEVASSNNERLAAAAIKAVTEWRFAPLVKAGEIVESKVRLPFVAGLPGVSSDRYAIF